MLNITHEVLYAIKQRKQTKSKDNVRKNNIDYVVKQSENNEKFILLYRFCRLKTFWQNNYKREASSILTESLIFISHALCLLMSVVNAMSTCDEILPPRTNASFNHVINTVGFHHSDCKETIKWPWRIGKCVELRHRSKWFRASVSL